MADFTIVVGVNSSGPILGTGTGYYDGATNGGFHQCGTATPDHPLAFGNGNQVSCWGWDSAYAGGAGLVVAIYGTLPQSYFTTTEIGGDIGISFSSAGVTHFSTTDVPGLTIWRWADAHMDSFIGQTLQILFFAVPTGKGDIENPNSWQDGSGNVPPANYDGIPGAGNI